MSVKKIAAVFVAAAIIGSATYSLTDGFILDDVVKVSAASSLRRNATGSEVTKLQNNLIKLNYMKSGSATGKYDAATESAVKKFQTDYNLTADGIAGTQTLNLISALVSGKVKVIAVKATLLNVRYTASTTGKLLTTVKSGQVFTVEGEASEGDGTKWYKIKTKYGSGYVCSDYVEIKNSASSTTPSSTKGIIKVTGSVLNVRQSASTSSKKLYTVKMGQTYYYTNVKNVSGETWYYINVNKQVSGWVLGKWATAVDSDGEGSSSESSGRLKVVVPILQVRQKTSTTSKRLYTTQRDEEYSFSKVQKVDNVNWYYIKVNSSISGWVLGTMVSVIPKETTPPTEATKTTTSSDPKGGTVTVSVDQLNVRDAAGTSGKRLVVVKRDQTFTYSKSQKVEGVDWYYIKVNNSISGWVMGTYVKVSPNSPTTTEATTAATRSDNTSDSGGGKLTVTADALNVRESASTSSKKLFVVKQNQTYSYSEKKVAGGDTWYRIKVNNSISGWVNGNYVNAVPNENTNATDKTTTTTASDNGSKTLVVIADALNVRESASTSSKKVFLVKHGQKYTYSKTSDVSGDVWYYIKVNNSISGWVKGTYVQIEESDATSATTQSTTATNARTTTTTSPQNADRGRLTVTANLLNVRSEATTKSKIITTVRQDSTYAFTDVRTVDGEKWYYITVSGSKKGWVNGGYVTVEQDASPTEDTTQNTTESTTASTTASTTKATTSSDVAIVGNVIIEANLLNVRIDPSSNATIIGTVKKDNIYEYTKTQEAEGVTWYYINVNNVRSGWVMGTYLRVLDRNSTVTTTPKSGTLSITANNVIVRKGAGTNYDEICKVQNGNTFQYIDVKNGWYRISLPDNKTGWVAGAYVTIDNAAGSTAAKTEATTKATAADSTTATTKATTAAPTTVGTTGVPISPTAVPALTKNLTCGTVKVSANSLIVRSGPGANYPKIGSVSNGSTVVIVSRGSSWHQIEYGNGTGYVSASCIKNITAKTETVDMSYVDSYVYIKVGQSVNLARSVSGSTVTYTSSDPNKCPVTGTGIASGVKEGLYKVTATCGSKTASVYVVVLKDPNSGIQTMQISEKGVQFIADWEGGETILPNGSKAFYPYKDVSGFWTLGYGHAITSTASKSWSEEHAIEELNKDIEALIGADYKLTDKRPYLTEEAARKLLLSDMNKGDYVQAINNWAVRNGVQLNQAQFDALVSFCYSVGSSLWNSDSNKFYLKSAILSHRSGSESDPNQIIEGFCSYYMTGGNANKGLWYRRRNEAELFLTGDYAIDRENKFNLPSGVNWS